MKRMLMILALCAMAQVFSSCAASEQKATVAPVAAATETSENTEQEIRRLNLEYDNAILHQDAAAMERLLADLFVGTETGGKLATKAQELADAKAGTKKYETGRSEDVKVRLYGDTAIVNGRWIEKSTTKGKPFDGAYLYTTVYAKRNGQWQIVSDQTTLVTQ